MKKLENTLKNKQEKREILENPYYNRMLGPKARSKRSSVNDTKTIAEDPKSPAHIKLLEESFPNPESTDLLDDSQHVRVKRNSTKA